MEEAVICSERPKEYVEPESNKIKGGAQRESLSGLPSLLRSLVELYFSTNFREHWPQHDRQGEQRSCEAEHDIVALRLVQKLAICWLQHRRGHGCGYLLVATCEEEES